MKTGKIASTFWNFCQSRAKKFWERVDKYVNIFHPDFTRNNQVLTRIDEYVYSAVGKKFDRLVNNVLSIRKVVELMQFSNNKITETRLAVILASVYVVTGRTCGHERTQNNSNKIFWQRGKKNYRNKKSITNDFLSLRQVCTCRFPWASPTLPYTLTFKFRFCFDYIVLIIICHWL